MLPNFHAGTNFQSWPKEYRTCTIVTLKRHLDCGGKRSSQVKPESFYNRWTHTSRWRNPIWSCSQRWKIGTWGECFPKCPDCKSVRRFCIHSLSWSLHKSIRAKSFSLRFVDKAIIASKDYLHLANGKSVLFIKLANPAVWRKLLTMDHHLSSPLDVFISPCFIADLIRQPSTRRWTIIKTWSDRPICFSISAAM